MVMDKSDLDPKYKYEEILIPDDNNPEESFCFTFVQDVPGILPGLLAELATKRKNVRAQMRDEKDKGRLAVLNKRQLAIKVSMNSVYGFLAAQKLPCKPIGACVTATGREMILKTKEYLEKRFPCTKVIYGDTDSVFVQFCSDIRELEPAAFFERASAISRDLTKELFRPPIQLEFEKVYTRLLLFDKKKK